MGIRRADVVLNEQPPGMLRAEVPRPGWLNFKGAVRFKPSMNAATNRREGGDNPCTCAPATVLSAVAICSLLIARCVSITTR